ncbi:MAG: TRC40/GET3/ArsA family transport-energizing ATPase [Candidatus Micrarchaeota archaeon]|nr:TRC40/GET3/ArsA family transport-energizing ATPase [Candidatus Micrarchaeota archaeon]
MKNKIKGKERRTQFYFFSGKGGVGKSSCSSATALHFAKGGKKTLILSTDPAHSLSDSFEIKIGGEIKELRKNLYAIEIDPKKTMEEYKEKFSTNVEGMEMLSNLGLGDAFDIAGMTPGIDEMASLDKIMQFMNSNEYDAIVFDTAPTGHTLRLLSLPDVLDTWLGKMITLKMKFSGAIDMFKKFLPFGDSGDKPKIDADQLEVMKERLLQARALLTNPERTSYNIVTIAEEMSIYESQRSLEVLKEYNIPVKTIIVNQLVPENPSCKFCTARRGSQQKQLNKIHEIFGKYEIKEVPLFESEVHGFKMLEKVAKYLYG